MSESRSAADHAAASAGAEVNYNCVCDEGSPLVCSRAGCLNEIPAGANMVVSADGSVFCSPACARGG